MTPEITFSHYLSTDIHSLEPLREGIVGQENKVMDQICPDRHRIIMKAFVSESNHRSLQILQNRPWHFTPLLWYFVVHLWGNWKENTLEKVIQNG